MSNLTANDARSMYVDKSAEKLQEFINFIDKQIKKVAPNSKSLVLTHLAFPKHPTDKEWQQIHNHYRSAGFIIKIHDSDPYDPFSISYVVMSW